MIYARGYTITDTSAGGDGTIRISYISRNTTSVGDPAYIKDNVTLETIRRGHLDFRNENTSTSVGFIFDKTATLLIPTDNSAGPKKLGGRII
ncbi:MAG: hypothetical protein ACK5LK_08120 [Chthoniobacterales bacterium]